MIKYIIKNSRAPVNLNSIYLVCYVMATHIWEDETTQKEETAKMKEHIRKDIHEETS